jgi:hypothetical protein
VDVLWSPHVLLRESTSRHQDGQERGSRLHPEANTAERFYRLSESRTRVDKVVDDVNDCSVWEPLTRGESRVVGVRVASIRQEVLLGVAADEDRWQVQLVSDKRGEWRALPVSVEATACAEPTVVASASATVASSVGQPKIRLRFV